MQSINWSNRPAPLSIRDDEVQIFRACLDVDAPQRKRLAAFLSEGEVQRADRFIFQRDRDHFVVGRGMLRELLGAYLHSDPKSLKFRTGRYGKLSLPEGSELRFNLSHSGGLALYGFAVRRELGIDVEEVRPEFAAEDVAERCFSLAERRELSELPVELRATAFFLCWTRKEAYVKAHGDGLQIPLDSFDVTLTPNNPAILQSEDSERWSLYSFEPAPRFVAAMLAEGKGQTIRFWSADAQPVPTVDRDQGLGMSTETS